MNGLFGLAIAIFVIALLLGTPVHYSIDGMQHTFQIEERK